MGNDPTPNFIPASTWLCHLAVELGCDGCTKGERQVVLPGDLELCSAALGRPFQKQQSFSMVPPCTVYATIVSRPGLRVGFPLLITTQIDLQRVLESISEKKQYSLSLSFFFSLSKTHLFKLKGNVSSGVNRNPA